MDFQDITLTEHGSWANIEIHEMYNTEMIENQEVLYYFHLPEASAIKELYLSNNENKTFSFRVSPRGAAAQVYESQVRSNRDPALLEQVKLNCFYETNDC